MKRLFYVLIAASVTVLVVGWGYLEYNFQQGRAIAAPPAEAALESTDTVYVDDGDWLVMKPAAASPTTGVIVYNGAGCDVQGYAEIMHAMAEAGYLVVGAKFPFNYSIFDPYQADEIRAAYPEVSNWAMVGHSMGGAMAARYAWENQDNLKGLILWDSYPAENNSLADSDLPVVHIHRATLEGEAPQKFIDMQHLFPADATWVPVPGGIHMYFGSFIGGGYVETWEPYISNAEAVEIITAATLDGLAAMQ